MSKIYSSIDSAVCPFGRRHRVTRMIHTRMATITAKTTTTTTVTVFCHQRRTHRRADPTRPTTTAAPLTSNSSSACVDAPNRPPPPTSTRVPTTSSPCACLCTVRRLSDNRFCGHHAIATRPPNGCPCAWCTLGAAQRKRLNRCISATTRRPSRRHGSRRRAQLRCRRCLQCRRPNLC